MNIISSSMFGNWQLESPASQCLGRDLQRALIDGSVSSKKLEMLLAENPSLVNQPLSSGELPLHTVVRETQQGREIQLEKVDALLRQGAEIDLKDAQGLTPMSHAALSRDAELMIKILGLSMGRDLHDLRNQLKLSNDIDHIEETLLDQQRLRKIDLHTLPPTLKATFHGNLSTFSVQDMIDYQFSGKQESILHYAIKGRQSELVKQIITKMKKSGLDIHQLDASRNSLLHYAIATDSPEITQYLITEGLPIDHRNSRGETPLHFAAAAGKTHLMQILVKGGASLKALDNGGLSPLVLYAQITKANDPLAIDELQLTLTTVTALYWLNQAAQSSGWKLPYQEILMPSLFLAVSGFELSHLLSNLKGSQEKFVALAGYFTLKILPPFNFGYHLWRTSYLAKDLFESCHSAWKNIRYRKWDATCKLAVAGINTASAVNSLYKSYQTNAYWYNLFYSCYKSYNLKKLTQSWTLLMKLKDGDLTGFEDLPELSDRVESIQAKLKYFDDSVVYDIFKLIDLILGTSFDYHSSVDVLASEKCPKVDPATAALPDVMRVSKELLIPECPKHAAIILSPMFNQTHFCKEVSNALTESKLTYLNQLYRNLSKALHPDKLSIEDKQLCNSNSCFNKITQARDVLSQEIHIKNYCAY